MKLNKFKFIFHFITNLFVVVSVIIFKSISCVSAKEINHSKFADHQQNHSKGVIWTDIKNPPAISLMITQGSENGWIVTTNVKKFLFTPKKAGKKHVNGEGHMHLYINNKKSSNFGKGLVPLLVPGKKGYAQRLSAFCLIKIAGPLTQSS